MSVNYNLLYYDSAVFDSTQFTPHLHCPVCGQDQTKRFWFDRQFAIAPQPVINFNAQVAILIPAHNDLATGLPCAGSGNPITLYIAIYKDATHPLMANVSILPIPANWWSLPI